MKKLLLTFIIWIFWFISFCSADTVILSWENLNTNIYITARNFEFWNNDFNINCTFTPDNNSYWYIWWELKTVSPDLSLWTSTYPDTYFDWTQPYSLTLNWKRQRPWGAYYYYSFLYIQLKIQQFVWTYHYTCTLQGTAIKWANSCPVCPTCPDPYTSLECQTEYNLIPIEDIDINYCVWNWLCPNESWTWDFSWDLQFSNIYINNILHPWRQNIFVTIPDYITWDYAFTGDDFNIYVWSWYDEEYINSIIKINSYRPTTTDFSDIFISWLTLVFPYIIVALFIVFVWKLLKRIFK